VEHDLSTVVDRNHTEDRAIFPGELLPGNDIGVVLDGRHKDLIALLDVALGLSS
jgi:hypothetical protein